LQWPEAASGYDRDNRAGRLEVLYNNTWGTVCLDGFNQAAANIVCRALSNTDGFIIPIVPSGYYYSRTFCCYLLLFFTVLTFSILILNRNAHFD